MIKTWANRASQRFYAEGKSTGFRGLDVEAAQDLLAALNAACSLKDLSPLKSIGLHKLRGNRAGQWAMTVNQRWRIAPDLRGNAAATISNPPWHSLRASPRSRSKPALVKMVFHTTSDVVPYTDSHD